MKRTIGDPPGRSQHAYVEALTPSIDRTRHAQYQFLSSKISLSLLSEIARPVKTMRNKSWNLGKFPYLLTTSNY
jgi:hypothetical protein